RDALFDGTPGYQLVNHDGPVLADAVGSIGRLSFGGWIVPGVHQKDMIGSSQVETGATRLERGQQHGWACVALEFLHDACTVSRLSVQACERDIFFGQVWLDAIEKARPLRKDQRLVPICRGVAQSVYQRFDFRGAFGVLTRQKTRMTSRLSKSQQSFECAEH